MAKEGQACPPSLLLFSILHSFLLSSFPLLWRGEGTQAVKWVKKDKDGRGGAKGTKAGTGAEEK